MSSQQPSGSEREWSRVPEDPPFLSERNISVKSHDVHLYLDALKDMNKSEPKPNVTPNKIDQWVNLMEHPLISTQEMEVARLSGNRRRNPPEWSFPRIMNDGMTWMREKMKDVQGWDPSIRAIFKEQWKEGPPILKDLENIGLEPPLPNLSYQNASDDARKLIEQWLPEIMADACRFIEAIVIMSMENDLLDGDRNPKTAEAELEFYRLWGNGPPGRLALRVLQARGHVSSPPADRTDGHDEISDKYMYLVECVRKTARQSGYLDNYGCLAGAEVAEDYFTMMDGFLKDPEIPASSRA